MLQIKLGNKAFQLLSSVENCFLPFFDTACFCNHHSFFYKMPNTARAAYLGPHIWLINLH